jgi:hypothetical protein
MHRAKITRNTILAVVILCSLLAVGCWVPALQPLYDSTNTVWDESLLGEWSSPDCTDTLANESRNCTLVSRRKSSGNEYELMLADERGVETVLLARLLRLGDARFLDTYISEYRTGLPVVYDIHTFPVHVFWRVHLEKNTLTLSRMSDLWLEAALNKQEVATPYQKVEDVIVLTGSTAELQQFFERNAHNEGAFSRYPMLWTRK